MHLSELLCRQKSRKAVELCVGFYLFTINIFLFTCLPQHKKENSVAELKLEKSLFIFFHDSRVLLPAFCPSLYLKQPSLGYFCKCYILPTLASFQISHIIGQDPHMRKNMQIIFFSLNLGCLTQYCTSESIHFSCRVHDFTFS